MRLSILVPVYNERASLPDFWSGLKAAPVQSLKGITETEIVIVDDGSTDGTPEWLAEWSREAFLFDCGRTAKVRFVAQTRNRGKGAAIRTALEQSTGDVIIIQDADLEYSPRDYPQLVAPIVDGVADAVFGSRFAGHPRRVLFFWHSLINRILTTIMNALLNINLTDMETGFKVLSGDLARSLRLVSNRFGLEPELTARLVRARARIYEVPIGYWGRTYAEGKKITALDGLAAFFHIFRFCVWDTSPFHPGLKQTLSVLDPLSDRLYYAPLANALKSTRRNRRDMRLLEVGAGMGSLTRRLTEFGHVTATDVSPAFVDHLRKRFEKSTLISVRLWDATQTFEGTEKFDCIVASNVLEHLADDVAALRNWKRLLAPQGVLVLLVPNHPFLFSAVDKAVHHFRRYSPKVLTQRLEQVGLRVEKRSYSNPFGILGWILNSVVLRRASIPSSQLRLYYFLKPLVALIEKPLQRLTGLNIVVVASSPSTEQRIERAA